MKSRSPEDAVETESLARFGGNFRKVRNLLSVRCPWLRHVRPFFCEDIDRERQKSKRAFMHTGHFTEVICAALAFQDLDDDFQCGILFHEFGHLLTPGGTEQDADRVIFEIFGIALVYKGELNVEWVDSKKLFGG